MLNEIQNKLLSEAKKAAEKSYSPYSQFRVGAAVYANGKVYIGANIENASSNLGICAERVAIAQARMFGAFEIEGIAVYCLDAKLGNSDENAEGKCLPCGACRQWLDELAPNAWVVTNGHNSPYIVSELLPKPFRLSI